jgi:hypothetical protein
LVPPGDTQALARALEFALQAKPKPIPMAAEDPWASIGTATKNLYKHALDARTGSTIAVQTLSEP